MRTGLHLDPMEQKSQAASSADREVGFLIERALGIERRLLQLEKSLSHQAESLLTEIYEMIARLEVVEKAGVRNENRGISASNPTKRIQGRKTVLRTEEGVRKMTGEEKLLGELAQRGVGHCDITRAADGTYWIQIEGADRFTMPSALAKLLEVLCEDNGASQDHLVGWKSVGEVTRMLCKRSNEDGQAKRQRLSADPKRDAHCVRQGLYRLRRTLMANQVNHKLVMVSRDLGVRFGLHHRRGFRETR